MVVFYVTQKFRVPEKSYKKIGRTINMDDIDTFWSKVGTVADKRGVYVFSMKAAKGEKPYYVGKAAKQSFREECFTAHKRADHYNSILGDFKGTPYLTFVVQKKTKGKWSQTAISEIEESLIAYAAARNKNLSNKRLLPDYFWSIEGVVGNGRGAPTNEAKIFRRLLGMGLV